VTSLDMEEAVECRKECVLDDNGRYCTVCRRTIAQIRDAGCLKPVEEGPSDSAGGG
jgi:hypothetical protein